jgi:hypothetical protein
VERDRPVPQVEPDAHAGEREEARRAEKEDHEGDQRAEAPGRGPESVETAGTRRRGRVRLRASGNSLARRLQMRQRRDTIGLQNRTDPLYISGAGREAGYGDKRSSQ